MYPLVSNGEFVSTCETIRLPDDVTVGYIVEHRLKTALTVVDEFHSHLEPLRMIPKAKIGNQVSTS
jgi:fringe protein